MFPSNSPDITLVFRGLFLFVFEEENKSCQLVVLQAERHCLKINIKSQQDSLPGSPEILFKVPDGDIFFEVKGRTNGVSTYEPGPFERNSLHDRHDLRWLLDFEGRELYSSQIKLRANALKRSVFVYNGLFYTHSSQEVIIRRPPPASPQADGTIEGACYVTTSQNTVIARSIGCHIYLDGQEEFQLRYGPDASYSINFGKEPKTGYEISVTNLCPHDAEQELAGSSDFALYYDIINPPGNQQFEIFRVIPPNVSDDRNPCNPASLRTTRAPLQVESMTE